MASISPCTRSGCPCGFAAVDVRNSAVNTSTPRPKPNTLSTGPWYPWYPSWLPCDLKFILSMTPWEYPNFSLLSNPYLSTFSNSYQYPRWLAWNNLYYFQFGHLRQWSVCASHPSEHSFQVCEKIYDGFGESMRRISLEQVNCVSMKFAVFKSWFLTQNMSMFAGSSHSDFVASDGWFGGKVSCCQPSRWEIVWNIVTICSVNSYPTL